MHLASSVITGQHERCENTALEQTLIVRDAKWRVHHIAIYREGATSWIYLVGFSRWRMERRNKAANANP